MALDLTVFCDKNLEEILESLKGTDF